MRIMYWFSVETGRSYKWTLRKGSKKEVCPRCGEKRFVPYVLASDGKTLAGEQYGRCDRESSCGYQRYPSQDAAEVGKPVERVREQPLRWCAASLYGIGEEVFKTLFCNWLITEIAPKTRHGVSMTLATIADYYLRSYAGQPLFWQITPNMEIRAAKTIPYKADGHRDHSAKHPALFLHREARLRGYYDGSELQQVFFGSHLLTRQGLGQIVIVESEKTAIALDILTHHKHCVLATGGSQMIKDKERCELVNRYRNGRRVMVYPDEGQYYQWREVCVREGWECSDMMEQCADKGGDDVLDLILNHYDEFKNIII